MTEKSLSNLRAGRTRNALLASAFALGVVGATGAGALFGDSHVALAQPVEAPAAVAPSDFTAVVETVRPAVVGVQVRTDMEAVADRIMPNLPEGFDDLPEDHPFNDFFRRFGMPRGFGDEGGRQPYQPRRGMSQGSGFFISEDGYVVTNAHVVQDANEITVIMDDGRELEARLIGTDERTDLALLKVEGDSFAYVNFAEEEAKVGQWVIAVGNPFGLGGTVTAGIISADGRDIGAGPYDNFLQIDAPVNRGNSGGPTFNTKGEVIGVNTAIFSPSGGNVGIAFAIPANMVQEIVSDLRDDGTVTRGWLGVQIQPVTEEIAQSLGIESTAGSIVADAQPGSPASEAGIQAGDIITEVDGTAVASPRDLSELIAGFEPNREISVTVLRDGEEREIEVTLGNLNQLDQSQQAAATTQEPPAELQPGSLDSLGITVEPNEGGDGVRVVGVEDNGPAAENGIRTGDVIVSIGDAAVEDIEDVEAGVSAAQDQGRGAVLLKVQGENGIRFVGVPLDRG